MKRLAGLLGPLFVMVSLSGCAHETTITVDVSNQTSVKAEFTVGIKLHEGDFVRDFRFEVGPQGGNVTTLQGPAGRYEISAIVTGGLHGNATARRAGESVRLMAILTEEGLTVSATTSHGD